MLHTHTHTPEEKHKVGRTVYTFFVLILLRNYSINPTSFLLPEMIRILIQGFLLDSNDTSIDFAFLCGENYIQYLKD